MKNTIRTSEAKKTTLCLLSLFAAVVLMESCTQTKEPEMNRYITEEELNSYLEQVLLFFPYSVDEEFIFENESTGEQWKAKAYDYGEGKYPHVGIDRCVEPGSECNGLWSVYVMAPMLESNGLSISSNNMSFTSIALVGQMSHLDYEECDFQIRLEERKVYQGGCAYEKKYTSNFSYLKDTIIMPIPNQINDQYLDEPAPGKEGAYARLVKHKGLTDFSFDGKTVWRRVK